MAANGLAGLGAFLQTFAGIRDEQAQRAEEKRRYEEQQRIATEERERANRLQQFSMLLNLRQAVGGGADVPDAVAASAKGTPAEGLFGSAPGITARPITEAGIGAPTTSPGRTFFKTNPEEDAATLARGQRAQALEALQTQLGSTSDPITKLQLQAALGGFNVPEEALLPYAVRQGRAHEEAKFQHGLTMQEIAARTRGLTDTPEERSRRALLEGYQQVYSKVYSAALANSDPNPDQTAAKAAASWAQSAQQMMGSAGAGAPADQIAQDIADIPADFQTTQGPTALAKGREMERRARKLYQNDPEGLRRYRAALYEFIDSQQGR